MVVTERQTRLIVKGIIIYVVAKFYYDEILTSSTALMGMLRHYEHCKMPFTTNVSGRKKYDFIVLVPSVLVVSSELYNKIEH
jgi:hypothetical protein